MLAIVLIGIRTFAYDLPLEPQYFALDFFFFLAFRTFMKWNFDRSSKRHILSILCAFFMAIVFLGMELFF